MKRGEIWDVRLDPTLGSEMKKTRPCVIVNRDSLAKLPLRIIVPLTEWNDRFELAPWHVRVDASAETGLAMHSSADVFQVRSVSIQRLIKRRGKLPAQLMTLVDAALRLSMDLDT